MRTIIIDQSDENDLQKDMLTMFVIMYAVLLYYGETNQPSGRSHAIHKICFSDRGGLYDVTGMTENQRLDREPGQDTSVWVRKVHSQSVQIWNKNRFSDREPFGI